MPILMIVGIILIPTMYILFSDPKPHNWRELGRYSSLYKTSFRENASSVEEVFKTLNEAGITPCFLNADLKK